MNRLDTRIFQQAVFGTILACLALAASGAAQDNTSTGSYQSGQATVTTQVKSAQIVYVSGNDVVVKMDDDGQVKHVVVPDSAKITVDGKELTVHDLQPGMHVTKTITSTSTPRTITTVRTVKGKVWYVNPPTSVILTLPDGTNKQYTSSKGQKFLMSDGKMHDLFDIHKGDVISATAITESPEVDVTTTSSATGTAPPPPPPPDVTPAPITALLIEAPAPAPQEVAQATLPKTGSTIPLLGLLGLVFTGMYFGCRALRAY
jgi:hypothetical protein